MVIVKLDANIKDDNYDYIFSSKQELDDMMGILTIPIFGVYTISVKGAKYEDIKSIIQQEESYKNFRLDIVVDKQMMRMLSMGVHSARLESNVSMFDFLKECIAKYNILIEPKLVSILYSSIDRDSDSIEEAVKLIHSIKGSYNSVSEKDLSEMFVLNKVTYPRQVLYDFVNMRRYRHSTLKKCINDMGKDVVYYSMIKNVQNMHKEKVKYLKTGVGTDYIKSINTFNLNTLYYMLVVDDIRKIKDIEIILQRYERGLI